jgi:hypothetical protein
MRRIFIVLLVMFSTIIIASIAFAANWQFIMTGQTPQYGNFSAYVDVDTVVKNKDILIFVVQNVFDNPGSGAKKIVNREEVNLSSRQYRYIETIAYDVNGVEVGRQGMGGWSPLVPNSPRETLVNSVLQYVSPKRNENAQEVLLHIDYEYQSGPYVRIIHGTVRDPQGLWQALLPLQPPPGARGGYGLIGDDEFLGGEPGFGLRQLGSIARRYITVESIYVKQPAGFSGIGVQEGVFTSVDSMNDTTLGWVFFDLRPKFESDLKQRLNL